MNLTIKGTAVSYNPEYSPTSKLWKVHLRDAFCIATIADTECFVKRFATKPRAWNFLVANKGKKQTGLPIIYEAKSSRENGQTAYYLFLEKIEGETLHDLVKIKKGGKASTVLLARAMAAAFRTCHTQGYWHADFCAKNIMVASGGRRYVVIDLDSLEPTAVQPTPTPNERGYIPDQELAVYALTYVQTYINPSTKSFSNIPGPALNLLQLVFLLDKLTYFAHSLKPKGTKFRELSAFKELPKIVHHNLGSYTDQLVKRILNNTVDTEMVITQPSFFLRELSTGKLLVAPPPLPVEPEPRLMFFRSSQYEVLPGQTFELSWEAEGPCMLAITKVGIEKAKGSRIIQYYGQPRVERYTITLRGSKLETIEEETIEITFLSPPAIAASVVPKPTIKQNAPSIVAFLTNNIFVTSGKNTIITWEIEGANGAYITHIGPVPAKGTRTFNSTDFNGKIVFELSVGVPAISKSISVYFFGQAASTAAIPTPKQVVQKVNPLPVPITAAPATVVIPPVTPLAVKPISPSISVVEPKSGIWRYLVFAVVIGGWLWAFLYANFFRS